MKINPKIQLTLSEPMLLVLISASVLYFNGSWIFIDEFCNYFANYLRFKIIRCDFVDVRFRGNFLRLDEKFVLKFS